MTKWLDHTKDERIAMIQAVSGEKNIEDNAVEKDWWVTIVLKALFNTNCGSYLLFKGGTSLSKGWDLIARFSEDIDISINRDFFLDKLELECAKCENNNQLKNLRRASRDYIHGTLSDNLNNELIKLGVTGYTIENVTTTGNPPKDIDHDADPTVISVNYESLFPSSMRLIEPKVKIEISCLSMAEPFEEKQITSLVYDKYPDFDDEAQIVIKTVTPSRTFIEKALLLNEEFQKETPRSMRMSRHMYDLEKIMDTEYGKKALNDGNLYKAIVEHRRKFYHLGYVDYDKDYPSQVDFIPKGNLLKAYENDYKDNMVDGYIYDDAKSFNIILARMHELLERFRKVKIDDNIVETEPQ